MAKHGVALSTAQIKTAKRFGAISNGMNATWKTNNSKQLNAARHKKKGMVLETLKNCRVEGNVVKLPEEQLDRKVYTEVKNKLELIGGKWKGGKVYGFVFNEDPTDLLAQIAGGENRNLKKEYQFFGTPAGLADRLVAIANPNDEDKILEPSAGQGAIVKAIDRYCEPSEVFCYELMPLNQTFLGKIPCCTLLGDDFLQSTPKGEYDVIVANPPFSKNQDIDHIRHMYAHLSDSGRMVSIASNHWQNSTNKKEVEFKKWLRSVNADIIPLDAGEFKESGTAIAACIVVINNLH